MKEKFFLEGPSRLEGEVVISGAKNAAVAIIPAVLLAEEPCVLENIPNINDVNISLQILQELGAKIKMRNKTTVEIDATHIIAPSVPLILPGTCALLIIFWVRCWGVIPKAR